MLEHLKITNFALIQELEIDFTSGFNVITGETGAGKSIILGALSLLMGDKADSSVVRTGQEQCIVDAIVSIPEGHSIIEYLKERAIEIDEANCIQIKRIVKAAKGARGLVSIQGQSVTLNELSYVSDSLIDLHSQHEHQSLILSDQQRKILDSYAHNQEILFSYVTEFNELSSLEAQKDKLIEDINKSEREKDYLKFALEEIKRVNPKPHEDEDLKLEIKALSQYENLSENISLTASNLSNAKDQLFDAVSYLSKATSIDPRLNEFLARLESIRIENEDIYESVRDFLGNLSFSQSKLDLLSDRLSKIQRLRKYGKTLDEVISYKEEIENILSVSENSEIELSKIEKKLKQQFEKTQIVANQLTDSRKEAALTLSSSITSCLRELGMPSGRFEISLSSTKLGPFGQDEVCYLITANKGEDPRSISQVASGGELSRIMLSIKAVLAEVDDVQTQIFDEVDTGIGGSVAQAVANQLKKLSQSRQVITITHLAQIACFADTHFKVSKHEQESRTFSSVKRIENEDRVDEIARMLSGEISQISKKHAQSLINLGQN